MPEYKEQDNREWEDIKQFNLEDELGGFARKIYPYRTNLTDEDMFLKADTTSVIGMSQTQMKAAITANQPIDEWEGLQVDENGDVYMHIFGAVTISDRLGKKYEGQDGVQVLRTDMIFGGLTNNIISNDRRIIYFYTLDEPYDATKYQNGTQQVYYCQNLICLAPESTKTLLEDRAFQSYIAYDDVVSEITFGTVELMIANHTNSRILFETSEAYNAENITQLNIDISNRALVRGFETFGYESGQDRNQYKNLDSHAFLTTNGVLDIAKLGYLKFIPTSYENELDMYSSWFDYNTVLPLEIAKKYLPRQDGTHAKLADAFKDRNGNPIVNGAEAYSLIKNMLLYTQMMITNWTRLEQKDKVDSITNPAYGEPLVNVTIGDGKYEKNMNILMKQNVVSVIDGLYEQFVFDEEFLDEETGSLVRAMVSALSRYIASSKLAIGQGLNPYNQFYLPWYLENATTTDIGSLIITQEKTDAGGKKYTNYYIADDSIELILRSKWYDIIAGATGDYDLEFKDYQINPHRLLKSENNLVQPDVPRLLDSPALNTINGSINITRNDDLKYIWNTTLDKEAIKNVFYYSDESSKISNKTFDIPTGVDRVEGYDNFDEFWPLNKNIFKSQILYSAPPNDKKLYDIWMYLQDVIGKTINAKGDDTLEAYLSIEGDVTKYGQWAAGKNDKERSIPIRLLLNSGVGKTGFGGIFNLPVYWAVYLSLSEKWTATEQEQIDVSNSIRTWAKAANLWQEIVIDTANLKTGHDFFSVTWHDWGQVESTFDEWAFRMGLIESKGSLSTDSWEKVVELLPSFDSWAKDDSKLDGDIDLEVVMSMHKNYNKNINYAYELLTPGIYFRHWRDRYAFRGEDVSIAANTTGRNTWNDNIAFSVRIKSISGVTQASSKAKIHVTSGITNLDFDSELILYTKQTWDENLTNKNIPESFTTLTISPIQTNSKIKELNAVMLWQNKVKVFVTIDKSNILAWDIITPNKYDRSNTRWNVAFL